MKRLILAAVALLLVIPALNAQEAKKINKLSIKSESFSKNTETADSSLWITEYPCPIGLRTKERDTEHCTTENLFFMSSKRILKKS